MKKIVSLILVVFLCVTSFCFSVSAEWKKVKVKIAPFSTEIDYMSVDNRYVEYPLITYKDITYFPMTFDLCAQLGLVCGYESEKGLFITREYVDYYPETPKPFGDKATNYYKKLYDAQIPTYPVYLNGVYIDNEKEEYPLINFRGITYFPMTWRFAYEELNFNIEWSEKDYSFKLYEDGKSSAPYAYAVEGNIVKLQKQNSVYETTITEEGGERHSLLYSYYSRYEFDTSTQSVSRKEDSEIQQPVLMPDRGDALNPTALETSIKGKSVYIGDKLLIALDNEESVTAADVYEYKTGESTLLHLTVQIGDAPAPYTTLKSYFFKKDASGIKQISWDERNNFSGIYPDGNGAFYISTRGYRPTYSGRGSNSFSDVYYYKDGADSFECITEKHKDLFNSMSVVGASDGKLYVLAMWYNAEKDRFNNHESSIFSAVNSGYYTIDMQSGELTKLYPYISGETFIGPDGNLYCISGRTRIPRIVNLNTGKIIPVQ